MKFRRTLKITSRTSSVTNGFVQAIIPCIEPSTEQAAEALAVLGMTPANVTCVYCGSKATDWDHLRPLVRGKRPTGYSTDIRNLVPACGPCNQSKSGQDWRTWISGDAKGSPKTRGLPDLSSRIAALEAFEVWSLHEPLEMRDIVGSETWEAYWARLEAIERQMREAQREAEVIRNRIAAALRKDSAQV